MVRVASLQKPMETAFRLISLRPCDHELFGMQWEGKFYYDKVLPFGLGSAPVLFNQPSDSVEWILLNHCGISFVCHISDDFFAIEPPSPTFTKHMSCQQSLSSMLLAFKKLGIPTAPHKKTGSLYNPRVRGDCFRFRAHGGSPSPRQGTTPCIMFYNI